MKVLILGGTRFLGRHFVEIALNQGYQVTLFNRGQTNNDLYPNVEKLVGDRVKSDLAALQGRKWDVVIDTAGYFPNLPHLVRDTAELLKDSVNTYVFISTISVYPEFQANGDETLPLYPINQELPQEMNAQAYGTLKAMAESVVQEVYGERGLITRPGLIVGPYDNTGRFTYWIRRISEGREVLAPESPELPVQYIDARDLVQWIYRLISTHKAGVYNAVGPDYSLKLGQFLATCQQVTGSNATFTWIPGQILESQGIQHWQELPLWLPPTMQNTFPCLSNSKALANGLRFRPLAETIRDIWQWDQVEQPEYASGLSQDKETAILCMMR
ncbi:NAD-dependent epimerase/dehydratase family protein [Nostoc sp. FACHB-152]|uniref:NAD-dependent epimerase/dehydratase family protein n=1 Tax=unclassified Nostoc TaxID=2593658 RepID=UPI0016873548|nr:MULTISPECIES: NAD-dependent epimerase/dehydratase family protein [unclassified Nostoc]MBD2451618.1 NAD-dependent epimerase/dehydratase family protein [Nostoc sp. FACHB-152]MBD2472721.1 NAD-dependent epimerase/dehydratase family protein [Nostoc sp. FACHB-145]